MRTFAFDEVSLQPAQQERRNLLGIISDDENDDEQGEENKDPQSHDYIQVKPGCTKTRFSKYVSESNFEDELSDKGRKVLLDIFGEDIGVEKSKENFGLVLDEAQINVINRSWRCQQPERLNSYRDEYRTSMPIHEKSKDILEVPTLDDLIESMLQKRHGVKATKNWGRIRQLFSQQSNI